MSLRVDANMFVGQYPFRECAHSSLEGCRARLARLGFDRAVVSPLEAVFQEDSFAAERRLAGEIAGSPEFIHFKVVNPARPWWKEDLRRGLEELGVRGIRLCSLYHGYSLRSPEAGHVLHLAAERDLPVLVTCRMQDERMQWLLRAKEPELEEIQGMLASAEANRLILAGLSFGSMLKLTEPLNRLDNVIIDTSRLQGPWKTFEKLSPNLDLSRVAFGSLWPISLPDCPFEQIRSAALDEETKGGILGGNFLRLCGGNA